MINRSAVWLTLATAALVLLSWLGLLDEHGVHSSTDALGDATATFAIARGINAVVSFVQEIELGAFGFVTVEPGQILDPLNDLVERFSWVMVAAMASLGIQLLLIKIGASVEFNALLSACAVLYVLALWARPPGALSAVLGRLLLVIVFLRFAVLGAVLLSSLVDDMFLAEDRRNAEATLVQTQTEISDFRNQYLGGRAVPEPSKATEASPIPEPAQVRPEGFWDRFQQFWSFDSGGVLDRFSAYTSERFKEALASLGESTEAATEAVVQLIVVFLLQTVVFPLLFLWLAYRLLQWALGLTRT